MFIIFTNQLTKFSQNEIFARYGRQQYLPRSTILKQKMFAYMKWPMDKMKQKADCTKSA